MSDNDKRRKILEAYLKNATPEERRELNALLKEGRKNSLDDLKTGGLNIDVNRLARNMSQQINQQLGMADINIKKMARDLVAQMAYQYKPDITEKELNTVINQMVPEKKRNVSERIPPEMMKSMIAQFVGYSTGAMSKKDQSQMPEGWAKKYWDAFSPDIRKLITAYLKNGIDSRSFWLAVDRLQKNK